MQKPLIFIATLVLFLVIQPYAAQAAVFSVNNVTELIDAINSANDEINYPGPDTINMTLGTYILTNVNNDTDGPNGLPSITSEITINGNESTIERSNVEETPEFRIFHVDSGGNLILNDLTISNGKNPEDGSGGGLYNKGILTLTTCNVSDNKAGDGGEGGEYGGDGGGLYNADTGTVTIGNSTFSGNQAGDGGYGIPPFAGPGDHGGDLYNGGTVTIGNSTFNDNQAGDGGKASYPSEGSHGGDGGGLYNGGTVTIDNSTFSGNQAGSANNWSPGGHGGGIYNGGTGTVTVDNSTFSSNQAGSGFWDAGNGGHGGGIYNGGTGIVTIGNSTFSGNHAASGSTGYEYGGSGGSGGGIYNGGTGTVTVDNSTFSGNHAGSSARNWYYSGDPGGSGGGLYNGGTVTIDNSTFSGNHAGDGGEYGGSNGTGGGIYNSEDKTLSLGNCIVANSSKGGDCDGIITSLDYNLDSDGSCNLTQPHDLPNTDPLLSPLADYGGPTLTHALLTGSPAIDAGDNTNCPLLDQRGVSRPQDGDNDGKAICDIGAFELLEAEPPVPNIKANGSDGPVEFSLGETLSVTIQLYPGIYQGSPADWWCVAKAPFGWYYYDAGSEDWLPKFKVSYQGPLGEVSPPLEVLNSSDLPLGSYTFYFGVDGNRNGNLDEPLYYDSVQVNIVP